MSLEARVRTFELGGTRGLLTIAVVAGAAILGPSLAAADGEVAGHRWSVRASALGVSTSGDAVRTVAGARFEVSGGTAFEVDVGYRVTSAIEIELGLVFGGDLDTDYRIDLGPLSFADSQDISMEGVWLGANYHFTPEKRADVFAGAFAGLTYFGDVIYTFPVAGLREKLTFDDDLGFGVRVGVDFGLGSRRAWFVSGGLRYLLTILEAEAGEDIDLDPLVYSVGVGYRF